jgi:hypothetical protein
MKFIYTSLYLCLTSLVALAHNFPLHTDSLYWKNRKPHAAYWQQDVHYTMKVKVDETAHTVGGHQTLQYWNNSPDTLYELYFHLHQNAFVEGAYTYMLQEANHVKNKLGSREKNGLGTVVNNVKVQGRAVAIEIDNTIMKVKLTHPMYPNTHIVIDMDFVSYWDMGTMRRRMKMYDAWGFMHYNGCQWYPKISVYDAKFGWDTYQHLGKEFYGDFGIFDVEIDFPSNYIVEATGALQNRKEVLPDSLRQRLDINNFKDKPWGEKPSEITPYIKGERKKWHFVAHHVHDFAFTADPSYRIGTTYWNGVECVGIAQEPHAKGWIGTEQLVADIIKNFSLRYGSYHYPKMIAADAADGMEYPMLTLDAGSNPGYRGLLVHEIGHNWYYGMIGSNETYRAALDEGFTQYITAEGLRMIDGDTMKIVPPKGWAKKHYEPQHPSDVRVLYPYVYNTTIGMDYSLNTHSDDFNGALHHGGGYAGVYYKSASMLYSLRVVLGDSLFHNAMLHYFHQWKFAHPYFEDLRNSIIQYTKVDLNWFFDQWLETTKPLDYGIKRIKKIKGTDSVVITFKRIEKGMQMPIDFVVKDKDGNTSSFHIPNNWYEKNTTAHVLPRWIGWGKVQSTYTARIVAPNGVKHVAIDTSFMMADRYMLNNSKTKGALIGKDKIKVKFDYGFYPHNDRKKYRLYWRPDFWYNGIDGLKLGIKTEGAYMKNILKVDAGVWWNTTLGRWFSYWPAWNETIYSEYLPINYSIHLSSPFSLQYHNLKWQLHSSLLDGFWNHQVGVHWSINNKHNLRWTIKSIYAHNASSTDYLIYGKEWSSFGKNKNTTLNIAHTFSYKSFNSVGNLTISARMPFLTNHYDYNYLQLENNYITKAHKLLIKTRVMGRLGMGNSLPYESSLFLAMASPEEWLDNKYTRSQMVIPHNWQGYNANAVNHIHRSGGMNLRGYAGYFAYDERDGYQYLSYKSRSGIAINTELDFTRYITFRPKPFRKWLKAQTYLFADAGVVELMDWNGHFENVIGANKWSDLRIDAGLGAAFTVHKWGNIAKAQPLIIRFDMPLFLNRPAFDEQHYVAFRWLLGIGLGL